MRVDMCGMRIDMRVDMCGMRIDMRVDMYGMRIDMRVDVRRTCATYRWRALGQGSRCDILVMVTK